MSFCADENPGFFETVQLYFTELTRRAIFLSGRDVEQLAEWREQGATATAICRGLRDAVEAMPDDDPPRDVYACRRYIEPHVRRARERSVGGRGSKESTAEMTTDRDDDLFARALDKIERAGRECDDTRRTELYREAWRHVRRLREEDDADPFEQLLAIEEGLLDGLYRTLDQSAREEIEERITSSDEAFVERMSPEAKRQHLRARRRRILIEEHELVSLIN